MPSRSKSKPFGNGTCATSCLSARVVIFMPSATPAMRLILAECGPATLTTTGASIVSPEASVTPATRPPRLADRRHLGIEAEGGALGLGGALGVVARELRIVDVAGAGEEHAAQPRPLAGLAEGRIVAAAWAGRSGRGRRTAGAPRSAPGSSPPRGCRARPCCGRSAAGWSLASVFMTRQPVLCEAGEAALVRGRRGSPPSRPSGKSPRRRAPRRRGSSSGCG